MADETPKTTTFGSQAVRCREYLRLLDLAAERRSEAARLRRIADETDAEAARISRQAVEIAEEILAHA